MKVFIEVSESFILVSDGLVEVAGYNFLQLRVKGWFIEITASDDGWGSFIFQVFNEKVIINDLVVYDYASVELNGVKITITEEV
jgi:hypothetical protein